MGFWLTAAINARPVINRQEKHTIPKQPERKKKREREKSVCVCVGGDKGIFWEKDRDIGKMERMRRRY